MKWVDARVDQNLSLLDDIFKRAEVDYSDAGNTVDEIVANVKKEKDKAIFEYTKRFDKADLRETGLRVTTEEIDSAYENVDESLLKAIRLAIQKITDFHEMQKTKTWIDVKEDGVILGQKVTPLERVGVYVPGGTAPYPSSVLMNVIPAKVAGVKEIIMITPPGKDGKVNANILIAAKEAGVTEIYKVGGAQGIAALAYGTESIPKVDKIVGPGNIYVALAKRAVYGYVDIDMIAGPSEILVIADQTANPKYVAADLLSQAEHDTLASSVLITDSEELGKAVKTELELQTQRLSRREIIEESLESYGAIIVTKDIQQAIDISNQIAPEHLEVCVQNPFELLGKIKHAGAIFLGNYSPEPLGDYMAGPNHVLPTSGTARFFSPLNVDDFVKKSSIISYSEAALKEIHQDIITFAKAEGLTAHANAIEVRFDEEI